MDIFGDWGFVGADNTTATPFQDSQQLINWYVEVSPTETSKTVTALLGRPGLVQVAAASGGGAPGNQTTTWPQPASVTNLPVRGMWVLPGSTTALAIIGNTCYLLTLISQGNRNTPGVVTISNVGTLKTNSGPVSIRDNNTGGGVAVIVDGPNGYYYNLSTKAVTQITDPNFLGASTVAYIDGWFVFSEPNSQTFYTNSAPYSSTFNASLFALKDSFSDNLLALWEKKEELWLFGERTLEIWYNAGGATFAFQRIPGQIQQIGCAAIYSISRLQSGTEDGLIWLARSNRGENIVVKTNGFSCENITTPAVSDAIASYSITSDAIGYTYQEDGHEFYVLNFPSADRTWVYDPTVPPQMAWHQRLSYDSYADLFHRDRTNCCIDFAGMRLVGDYQNGSIYQMTRAVYTDGGWPILSRRRSPFIWDKDNRQRMQMASLQVDFATGVGNASGMGVNPQATLRLSRDYGKTYGEPIQSPIGLIGNYTNRCLWRKLGWTRGTVAQIEVIDPVNRDIVGATLRAMGA